MKILETVSCIILGVSAFLGALIIGGIPAIVSAVVSYLVAGSIKSYIVSLLIVLLLFIVSLTLDGISIFGVLSLNLHDSVTVGAFNNPWINLVNCLIFVYAGNQVGSFFRERKMCKKGEEKHA